MDGSASRSNERAGSSRAAFIRATARLVRRQGYAATGLQEIVTESGAPKGSLYFHFPGGKEELAVEALRSGGEGLRRLIARTLEAHERPADGVAALLDAMAAGLASSGYTEGCPIATVTLEAAAQSGPIRATAAGAFGSWTGEIERALAASGIEPERARRLAVLALAAIEGALILARAERSLRPLEDVRAELDELLR